jgi:hypothetical protein
VLQGRSGRCEEKKILDRTGTLTLSVIQPVANRYADNSCRLRAFRYLFHECQQFRTDPLSSCKAFKCHSKTYGIIPHLFVQLMSALYKLRGPELSLWSTSALPCGDGRVPEGHVGQQHMLLLPALPTALRNNRSYIRRNTFLVFVHSQR